MVNVPPREVSARFNVLLTEDREHAVEHWTQQLPRLLEPMGVQAFLTRTGREALDLASRLEIHAAVVDLLTPAGDPYQPAGRASYPGGLWLLELLRRLPTYPPVVVVSDGGLSQRQVQRCLNEALRLGAFAVVNRPVEIESLLEVIRRLVDRRYAGGWPTLPRPSQSPRRPGGLRPGLTEA